MGCTLVYDHLEVALSDYHFDWIENLPDFHLLELGSRTSDFIDEVLREEVEEVTSLLPPDVKDDDTEELRHIVHEAMRRAFTK